jgi:hypothetical protein
MLDPHAAALYRQLAFYVCIVADRSPPDQNLTVLVRRYALVKPHCFLPFVIVD